MNLPQYLRAVRAVHEDYVSDLDSASSAYREAISLAGDRFHETLEKINAEFHEDADAAREIPVRRHPA